MPRGPAIGREEPVAGNLVLRQGTEEDLMRILYLDLDTLRPDHLGCYGYHRQTSPNIDWIASEGVRFENYYASDVPCLPSRSALFSGRLGIHNGAVGHGGTAADPKLEGYARGFRNSPDRLPWMGCLARQGIYPVSISPFAERHSAWHFCAGFREMVNPGKGGMEIADDVTPLALDWIERNAKGDGWFLQVNYWDPHTPYRTPKEYGNPFQDEPPPDWPDEDTIRAHYEGYGPHSAHEPGGYGEEPLHRWPRVPEEIASREDFRRWIDGYDVGIRYMDDHIGRLLSAFDDAGVLDDLVIFVSADHGENQGELNVYGDHQTADQPTCRVPMIVRWPGIAEPRVNRALHYAVDWAATTVELAGGSVPELWDGRSFAKSFRENREAGREYLVVSQCAWSCQRAVRWGPWLLVRTYHDGLKDFPEIMLFNIENDPHETKDLADERPDVVAQGVALLERWHGEMMETAQDATDPLWTVMREGGPFHTRGKLAAYCRRLRETGRAHHAEALERRHKE
jgi:choline-sulfatase